jgi:hypothetical protein
MKDDNRVSMVLGWFQEERSFSERSLVQDMTQSWQGCGQGPSEEYRTEWFRRKANLSRPFDGMAKKSGKNKPIFLFT